MSKTVERRGARASALAALGLVVAALCGASSAAAAEPIPPGGVDITSASLDWLGNEEIQSAPPFGGSNYLSAGISGGNEASYRASDGNVSIYQVSDSGQETVPTWASRAAYIGNGGDQLARVSAGSGHLNADGTGGIAWEGSFSVNFYGGLVPFTIADPEIYFGGDGTGFLSADLEGCSSSMSNPNECVPLAPASDAIIATFQGVTLEPAGTLTIQPDYAGVEVTTPEGTTPQNREVAGWGAWPQEFVDFQQQTGLSSYWYSSGGGADPKKPPLPFVVDLGGAEGPGPEVPSEEPQPEAAKPDGGDTGSGGAGEPETKSEPSPPTAPAPVAKRARVWQPEGPRKLDESGTAQLARVACPAGGSACSLVVPERKAARLGGKRYLLTVLAPDRIKPGAGASVRIRVPKGARAALGAGKLTLRVPIVVASGGATSKQIAKVTIVGRG